MVRKERPREPFLPHKPAVHTWQSRNVIPSRRKILQPMVYQQSIGQRHV